MPLLQSLRTNSIFVQSGWFKSHPWRSQSLVEAKPLAAYEVQLEDVLADARMALKQLSVDMEYDNRKVGAEQQALDATNQRSLALVRVELDRLKAIAEVNARGANIMANMAEGAMSAANGVAGVLFEEF